MDTPEVQVLCDTERRGTDRQYVDDEVLQSKSFPEKVPGIVPIWCFEMVPAAMVVPREVQSPTPQVCNCSRRLLQCPCR